MRALRIQFTFIKAHSNLVHPDGHRRPGRMAARVRPRLLRCKQLERGREEEPYLPGA